jgi:hypothetical protein
MYPMSMLEPGRPFPGKMSIHVSKLMLVVHDGVACPSTCPFSRTTSPTLDACPRYPATRSIGSNVSVSRGIAAQLCQLGEGLPHGRNDGRRENVKKIAELVGVDWTALDNPGDPWTVMDTRSRWYQRPPRTRVQPQRARYWADDETIVMHALPDKMQGPLGDIWSQIRADKKNGY